MGYVRKLVIAGDVLEISEYYEQATNHGKIGTQGIEWRTSNTEEDREKRQEEKYKARLTRLARLINANFTEGDLSLSLTFRKSVSIQQSKIDLVNYLRALKRRRKKLGLSPLKYIAVTEYGSSGKNKHHHLIINDMPADDVMKLWKHGTVMAVRLDPRADYKGLAVYITKEPKRKFEKQIRRSRNLAEPTVKIIPAIPTPHDIRLPYELEKRFHVVEVGKNLGAQFGCRKYLKAIAKGGHDWGQGDELLG